MEDSLQDARLTSSRGHTVGGHGGAAHGFEAVVSVVGTYVTLQSLGCEPGWGPESRKRSFSCQSDPSCPQVTSYSHWVLASLPSLHLPFPGSAFNGVPLASVHLTHRQAHQSHQEHRQQMGHDGAVRSVSEGTGGQQLVLDPTQVRKEAGQSPCLSSWSPSDKATLHRQRLVMTAGLGQAQEPLSSVGVTDFLLPGDGRRE